MANKGIKTRVLSNVVKHLGTAVYTLKLVSVYYVTLIE